MTRSPFVTKVFEDWFRVYGERHVFGPNEFGFTKEHLRAAFDAGTGQQKYARVNMQETLLKLAKAIDFYDGAQPRIVFDADKLREIWDDVMRIRGKQ